ncbi:MULTISPECIES: hypothetical protein [unclassified Exiguobacterium]|uniref:hypothetical protein n=1 Tax=unclassified Exiguobacterium TaxID=2644629 RepID=UPI001BEA8AB1|nr:MULTISPECIES: hypothetical protein [unclassified Exiguobacterium]
MGISIAGYLVFFLTILCNIRSINFHFKAMIVSSVFTATSVANVNIGSIDFSIIPLHLIGGTFFLRILSVIILKKQEIYKKNKYITVFIVYSFLSVLILAVNQHNIPDFVTVRHYYSGEGFDPIFFSMGNVTQLFYLFFGFVIYWSSYEYLKDLKSEKKYYMVLKMYIISSIIVAVIGIYELFAKTYNLPFMVIFRNVNGVVNYDNLRISSVAHEPSMFAYFIVISIGIYIYYDEKNILTKYKKVLLPFIVLIGLLSTSTTFILGFISILIYLLFQKISIKKIVEKGIKPIYYFYLLTILCLGLVLLNIPFIKEKTIGRAYETLTFSNFSGSDRIEKFMHHIDAFEYSPIFGFGFGTTRSYDGLTTILTNGGILGFLIFVIMIIKLFIMLKKAKSNTSSNQSWIYSLELALVSWIAMFTVSVPEIYFGYIWIIFASISVISSEKLNIKRGNIDEKAS